MTAVLDLFCGAAGGWSVGMAEAGYRTVAACEADPWRRAVFAAAHPGVAMFEDIRTLTAVRLEAALGYLPPVIVGSPPCQDASVANHAGKGVDGARTGLFFEAIRLVGECRPHWVCLENVAGIRARGADRIIDALEAIGYAPRPVVAGAWHALAPHRRGRAWFLAVRADLADAVVARFRAAQAAQAEERPALPLAGLWCGAGGLGRHPAAADAGAGGQPAERQPERAGIEGEARREPVRCVAGPRPGAPPADADGDPLRIERQWLPRRRPDELRPCGHAEPARAAGDAEAVGCAVGQGGGFDLRSKFAALARAVGARGHLFNGGLLAACGVDDGLSARLARIRVPKSGGGTTNALLAAVAAYGDAVMPPLAAAIGRTMQTLCPVEAA